LSENELADYIIAIFMKNRFAFVNLSINCGYNSGMNHGIAFLNPIVRRHGYEVICINLRKEVAEEEFRNKIEEFSPSIIAFSCNSNQLKYLAKYSGSLSGLEALQICGGPAATLDNEWILNNTLINAACIGEGEIPLESLLKSISENADITSTEGFYFKTGGSIRKNPVPAFLNDLSKNELPDFTVFDGTVLRGAGGPSVMLSRGCPYNCYYCCNKALSSVYEKPGGYFRVLPVDKSIQLIKSLIGLCPDINFLHFEDDLLIANKRWFFEFAEKYSSEIGLPYRMCVRVECVTPEIVTALKKSGCKLVFVGLESGDEQHRKKYLNRHYTNQLFIEKCKLIKAAGIKLFTFNIVGFPNEGANEMLNTYLLNRAVEPDSGVCTFFYPYKNTELYKICEDLNVLINKEELIGITNYNTKPAIKMSAIEIRACVKYQRKIMNYLTNRGERTEISELQFGLYKANKVARHLIKSVLRHSPFFDRLIRGTYARLKLKAIEIRTSYSTNEKV